VIKEIFQKLFQRLYDKIPRTATAPFCPSEISGSVVILPNAGFWKTLFAFLGPGLLISVGYMDPGNWATDIEAGSKFGFSLLSVVLFASFAAIVLQYLSQKLGLATKKDLARLCREQYHPKVNFVMWILAELAIIACDLAEVLGSALAFKLMFGISMITGIIITAFDTLLVLGLKGKGFRQVEAVILGLIITIGLCFAAELFFVKPDWLMVSHGFIPTAELFRSKEAWFIAIGIMGATVMPHNLYLHSSIVQTRKIGQLAKDTRRAIRFSSFDTISSLTVAFFINAAILILAGAAFHDQGVAEIQDAYRLLEPIIGTHLAPLLFAIALLASGQSSTFTGTIAGQILMEGYLDLKIPCWQRRLITRGLAVIPAIIGIYYLGENSVGKLLVLSQVILSFQLPFALYPLIRFTSSHQLMGEFANKLFIKFLSWFLFFIITAANLYLIWQIF
jgi:manganese transport protein